MSIVSFFKWVADGPDARVAVSAQSPLPVTTNGRSIPAWDYRSIAYTDDNPTTVTYKVGGASGLTVAVQTLAYDGSNNVVSETWS
jgi:hypothetical protein